MGAIGIIVISLILCEIFSNWGIQNMEQQQLLYLQYAVIDPVLLHVHQMDTVKKTGHFSRLLNMERPVLYLQHTFEQPMFK